MNMRGDANRSVRLTKRRLYDAFTMLAANKPVTDITVRELTTLAGVSRGTFYFHYTDIYDLLRQLEQEQLEGLGLLLDNVLPQMEQNDPPHALTTLFEYLDENAAVCSALLGENGDQTFVRKMETLIAQQCLGYAVPGGGTTRQRYLTAFYVHGCLGCVAAWFYEGRREKPAEMAQTVWQAVRTMYRCTV